MITLKTVSIPYANENNIGYIDITRGTGIDEFAPPWNLVKGYKQDFIPESQYRIIYNHFLELSFANNREIWDIFFEDNREYIVGCYCAAGKFCHRLVFVEFLIKKLKEAGHIASYEGEL